MKAGLTMILAGAVLVFLPGCAALPTQSALALSRVDPMTTDAAAIRVAYLGPAEMRVRGEDARLVVQFSSSNQAMDVKQSFALREVPAAEGFTDPVRSGQHLQVYALRPDEVARFNTSRTLMAAERPDGGGKGTISVAADGCLSDDHGQPLRFSAYLRTAETGRFVALLENADMRDYAATTRKPIKRCDA